MNICGEEVESVDLVDLLIGELEMEKKTRENLETENKKNIWWTHWRGYTRKVESRWTTKWNRILKKIYWKTGKEQRDWQEQEGCANSRKQQETYLKFKWQFHPSNTSSTHMHFKSKWQIFDSPIRREKKSVGSSVFNGPVWSEWPVSSSADYGIQWAAKVLSSEAV